MFFFNFTDKTKSSMASLEIYLYVQTNANQFLPLFNAYKMGYLSYVCLPIMAPTSNNREKYRLLIWSDCRGNDVRVKIEWT